MGNVTTATDVKGKEDVGHLLESARPDEQMMLVLLRGQAPFNTPGSGGVKVHLPTSFW